MEINRIGMEGREAAFSPCKAMFTLHLTIPRDHRELRHLRHRRLETINLCTVQLLPSPIANPSLQGPHLSIRKASRVATLQVLKKGLGRLGRVDLKPQPELLPDFRKRILSSLGSE